MRWEQLREKEATKFRHLAGVSPKTFGNGAGYQYPHDFEGGFVPQRCLPTGEGRVYYDPTTNGLEARIKERLDHFRAQFEASEQG